MNTLSISGLRATLLFLLTFSTLASAQAYKGTFQQHNITRTHERIGCPGPVFGIQTKQSTAALIIESFPVDFGCEVMAFNDGKFTVSHPVAEMEATLAAGATAPTTATVTMPVNPLVTAAVTGTMQLTQAGEMHGFRVRAEIKAANTMDCTAASRSSDDFTSTPATFPKFVEAVCRIRTLNIVPGSIQMQNSRITRFDAELRSEGVATMDHGSDPRGGVFTIEVRSVYRFELLADAVEITGATPTPDPLRAEKDARVQSTVTADLKGAPMGKVRLTGSYQNEAGVLTEVVRVESDTFAAGMRTLTLNFPAFEAPPSGPLILQARLFEVGGASRELAVSMTRELPVVDDLTIEHIEFVQVVQDAANSIPIIANKAAYIRVFPKTAADAKMKVPVPVRLEFGRPGSDPVSGVISGDGRVVGPRPRREQFQVESYDFFARAELVQEGDLRIRAIVNPDRTVPEYDYGNNELTVTVRAQRTRGLVVKYVPVCVEMPGQPIACGGDGTPHSDWYLERAYPLADGGLSYSRLEGPALVLNEDLTTSVGRSNLLRRLERVFLATVAASGGLIEFDQLVGWVPHDKTNVGGQAGALWGAGNGRTALLADYTGTGFGGSIHTKLAHEVGHNLGLRHAVTASCQPGVANNAGDPGTDWPHLTANIQEHGAVPLNGAFILGFPSNNPEVSFDLMSYCSPRWMSPHQYRKVFNSEFVPQNSPADVPLSGMRFATGDHALISGLVSRDGSSGVLDPIYTMSGSTQVSVPDPAGDYCLVFRDAGAQVLDRHCFRVSFQDAEDPRELTAQSFARIVLEPAGAARLTLEWTGRELAALNFTANDPAVQFTAPAANDTWQGGQQQVIRWSGSDPDGGALTYSLFYTSGEGAAWIPLAVDLRDAEFRVSPADLRGGPNVRFRVIASDGFRSGEAFVGPINVQQRPEIAAGAAGPIDFGPSMVGVPVNRQIELRNTGTGPLTITSVASSSAAFRVTGPGTPFMIAAGSARQIDVAYMPAEVRADAANLTIASNAANQPSLAIALQGNGSNGQTPGIGLNERAVALVDVEAGTTAQHTFQVRNASLVDLNVQWQVSGAAFAVDGDRQFTLKARESRVLPVKFTPPAPGTYNGTLTLTTNDPRNAQVAVMLFGTGLPKPPGSVPSFTAASIASAATFATDDFASEMWVAIFGTNLADELVVFDGALPTSLGGTRVTVTDSTGAERAGLLQFVSPTRLNFLIPAGTALGPATVSVSNSSGLVGSVEIEIKRVAPGLFSANATGQGPAAATYLRVSASGERTEGFTFTLDANRTNAPVSLGGAGDQVYLSFFGTGFRGRSTFAAKIGGQDVPVAAAIAQGQFEGLDQAVIGPLPASLAGRGEVPVEFTFDGVAANTVTVAIQ